MTAIKNLIKKIKAKLGFHGVVGFRCAEGG